MGITQADTQPMCIFCRKGGCYGECRKSLAIKFNVLSPYRKPSKIQLKVRRFEI